MNDTVAFLSPASFWVPEHLPASDWIEHAPFAFWLIQRLAPRRFVELGTDDGLSYFAVCQAVRRLGLATQARAIDSWAGNPAGYREVASRNRLYADFSTVVRAGFDDARLEMAPGSIDLLHIDGPRGYGEVGHLFDTWRPLLTEDAVVLLHGTSAWDGQGGVGELFDELRSRYPTFHLAQGRGLGLVVPGGSVPAALRPLLEADDSVADRTRTAYAALGSAVRSRRQSIADRHGLSILLDRLDPIPGGTGEAALPGDCVAEVARLSAILAVDPTRRLPTRFRTGPLMPGDPAAVPVSSGSAMAQGESGTSESQRLKAELRDVRAREAEAHRYARAARRALQARHGELGRQALDLEQAAAAARGAIDALAEDAWRHFEREHAADHSRAQAQRHLDDLLRHEQAQLTPAGGLRDVLSLGALRRWRRKARNYAALIAGIDATVAEIRGAQDRYAAAKEARRLGEGLANAAQPRASELASAAVVLRGEHAASGEILSIFPAGPDDDGAPSENDYGRWVALYDTLTEGDRRAIRARLTRLRHRPLISVVMPVYDTPVAFLRQAVASVQSQLYPDWELCIADDASPDPAVRRALGEMAAADPRIKLVLRPENGHISAASNSALALATGEFVALMDHDDILPDHALFEVAAALNDRPDLDLIYSDEDHIDADGRRNTPYFKSDFNPDLLLGHNLVSHLGVYRRALVERVGGFRLGYEGSQDYDLALRVVDASSPARIHHIPAVLYHWRSGSGDATFSESAMQRCIAAARRALADHLERRGEPGEVVAHPAVPSWQRILRPRPDPAPLVSVIVPTKDKAEILRPCIEGLLHRTAYPDIEVLIVDHQSREPEALQLLEELARDPRVRVLPHEGPFNYSAINNAAVAQARGPVLALLNNDVDVIDPDWLDEMVALAVLPEVGAVGAKLLYPDDRVQHAGVILGAGGVANHFFHRLDADDPGYFGRAALTSSVAAVTAACLVVRRSVFDEAGGFDEANLPVAFNDVDLCLKIGRCGYRNVWTPHARLYHHESLSRGSDLEGERLERFQREVEFMLHKWEEVLAADPFYNPNLDLASTHFALAFPPRRRKPWRTQDMQG